MSELDVLEECKRTRHNSVVRRFRSLTELALACPGNGVRHFDPVGLQMHIGVIWATLYDTRYDSENVQKRIVQCFLPKTPKADLEYLGGVSWISQKRPQALSTRFGAPLGTSRDNSQQPVK